MNVTSGSPYEERPVQFQAGRIFEVSVIIYCSIIDYFKHNDGRLKRTASIFDVALFKLEVVYKIGLSMCLTRSWLDHYSGTLRFNMHFFVPFGDVQYK